MQSKAETYSERFESEEEQEEGKNTTLKAGSSDYSFDGQSDRLQTTLVPVEGDPDIGILPAMTSTAVSVLGYTVAIISDYLTKYTPNIHCLLYI